MFRKWPGFLNSEESSLTVSQSAFFPMPAKLLPCKLPFHFLEEACLERLCVCSSSSSRVAAHINVVLRLHPVLLLKPRSWNNNSCLANWWAGMWFSSSNLGGACDLVLMLQS